MTRPSRSPSTMAGTRLARDYPQLEWDILSIEDEFLAALRAAFLYKLTTDSTTRDRRRADFNTAIFDANEGYAIWTETDLSMVMDAFENAVKFVRGTIYEVPHG